MYSAKILLDSENQFGDRLVTWELSYPRFVHAELMTHRVFSRNAASSRAIPTDKLITLMIDDPAMPVYWGKNQSGMQAKEELSIEDQEWCKERILKGQKQMIELAQDLQERGLHKQIANRYIEPWMFIKIIMSTTEHDNWFALRAHEEAQPEIADIAFKMKRIFAESKPNYLKDNEWHLPLLWDKEDLIKEGFTAKQLELICIGRCCRISYLTHDGKRDPNKDIQLAERILKSGHMSPFEHAARPMTRFEREDNPDCGNFRGFVQARKHIAGEAVFGL